MRKSFFIFAALLAVAFGARAQYSEYDYYGSNYEFRGHCFFYDSIYYHTLTDSTVEVFAAIAYRPIYTWPSNILTIPSTVYDSAGTAYTVTRLGNNSLEDYMGIDSVELPETLLEIGEDALHYTDITHISIPQGVRRIESGAFSSTLLTGTVVLPDSLEYIGEYAFAGTNMAGRLGITALEISPSAPRFCTVDGVLYNKDTTVVLMATRGIGNDITMPPSVRRIEHGAYRSCFNSYTITLGDSVRELGLHILPSTIRNFAIPQSVVHIDGPINSCYIAVFNPTIDPQNTHYYIDNGIVRSTGGDTLVMCFGVWSGAKSLPEGIKVIAPDVFLDNATLTRVDLPTTLEEIGDYAFAARNVNIEWLPSSLRRIGRRWLNMNAVMTDTLVLPSSLEYLAEEAFAGCHLRAIVLSDSLRIIPSGLIAGCRDIRAIYIGNHVERIEPAAFVFGSYISTYYYDTVPLKISALPATLRSVGVDALRNRTLDSVVFLGAPDSIGANAFNLCPRVVFYDSVPPVVFDDAFANANTVVVPCGATTAFTNAPGWGTAFTYVEMPCPVAVDDVDQTNTIYVDPNPATTTVTVKSDVPILQVEAFDATSAKIYSLYTDSEIITLDVRRWPSGTYLLRIHTPKGTAVKKLIVK